jgi:hypothetical protein
MRIVFRLEQRHLIDFSEHVLASSPYYARSIRRARWMIPVIYLCFGLITGIALKGWYLPSFFFLFAAAWVIWCPRYIRKR